MQKFKKSKIIIFFFVCFFLFTGAIFNSSIERYTYLTIDLMFSWKKNTCNTTELIETKSLTREVIRDDNVEETEDSWIEKYTELQICPKKTAFLLIDTWDVELEKNDVVKNAHQKVMNLSILPTINNFRKKGGLIIHSLSAGKSYPNSINTKTDINLSWSDKLPKKLQTIILFWTLKYKGIDKVIYAGFSTNMCLYDRPHGIYFTEKFKTYIDRFLLKEGTSTWEFSKNNPNFTENLIKHIEWQYVPTISKKYFNP